MAFYQIEGRELWGDYGDMLIHGMITTKGGRKNTIALERCGPFVPPMTLPGTGTVVVTAKLRSKMKASRLFDDVKYRRIVGGRIVRLDWHRWNLKRKEPKRYPAGLEPENYILGRKHSPELLEEIGPLYLAVIPMGAEDVIYDKKRPYQYKVRVKRGTWNGAHLFWARNWLFSDEEGRAWLERECEGWLVFHERPK